MTRRDFTKTATALAGAAGLRAAEAHYSLEVFRGWAEIPERLRNPRVQTWLLEAMIAPHVPEFVVVRADGAGPLQLCEAGHVTRHQVYELRSYAMADGAPPPLEALRRNGIRPMLHGAVLDAGGKARQTYLIAFDSLEARTKAWDALVGDRDPARGPGYGVSFYRRVA